MLADVRIIVNVTFLMVVTYRIIRKKLSILRTMDIEDYGHFHDYEVPLLQ